MAHQEATVVWLFIACHGGPETDVETDLPAPAGVACPLNRRTALVDIRDDGFGAQVDARVYDKADPWLGEPALADDNCRYYAFNLGSCGPCEAGDVCGVSGGCVPERRAIKDARVIVRSGEVSRTFEADPTTGQIYGALDLTGPYEVTLVWESSSVVFEPAAVPTALDVSITAASNDFDHPGDLSVEWAPADGGHLYTTIPVNHHAGGPTFTTCLAPSDLGSFTIDAAMVDPLSVITGLEFQGMDRVHAAAVELGDACVDLRVGTRLSAWVQVPS